MLAWKWAEGCGWRDLDGDIAESAGLAQNELGRYWRGAFSTLSYSCHQPLNARRRKRRWRAWHSGSAYPSKPGILRAPRGTAAPCNSCAWMDTWRCGAPYLLRRSQPGRMLHARRIWDANARCRTCAVRAKISVVSFVRPHRWCGRSRSNSYPTVWRADGTGRCGCSTARSCGCPLPAVALFLLVCGVAFDAVCAYRQAPATTAPPTSLYYLPNHSYCSPPAACACRAFSRSSLTLAAVLCLRRIHF